MGATKKSTLWVVTGADGFLGNNVVRQSQHASHELANEKLGYQTRPQSQTIDDQVRWFDELRKGD